MLVLLAIGMWGWQFYFRESVPPFEDAAMLLRYAQHLADGHGIVWNVGDAPVDGATDFLFMVMVAGLVKLGMGLNFAARVLTISAHVLTVIGVYGIHRRQANATAWSAGLSALIVGTGPGWNYCEALFGTPVFAMAGLFAFGHFIELMMDRGKRRNAIGFAAWGIVTGLIRPEGVILVVGMLLSLIWYLRDHLRRQVLQWFLIIFVVPGAVYFGWHWWYFGHPLPNPFYVKGGGTLYLASLKASFIGVVKMGLILLPILAWAAWKKDARRKTMLLIGPVFLFAVSWILMSNAMNFSSRFQYILMPILWVAWLPIVGMMRPGIKVQGKWLAIVLPLAAVMLAFHYFSYASHNRIHRDGRADLGIALRPWAAKGYTMAVTEAGNLPLHSGWRAIDTWGLNDSHIAHQGHVDAAYLDREAPVLVMVHDYYGIGMKKLRIEPEWAVMTDSLDQYLKSRDYELVARWGRVPESTHFYYLKRAQPDYEAMKGLIGGFLYFWYEDGYPAESFMPPP